MEYAVGVDLVANEEVTLTCTEVSEDVEEAVPEPCREVKLNDLASGIGYTGTVVKELMQQSNLLKLLPMW